MNKPHKLSASALSTYLKSPKAYYMRYIRRLDPIAQSVANFDEAKLVGVLWSEWVDRFYKGVEEDKNTDLMLDKWTEQSNGWVPDKTSSKLVLAMESWATEYCTKFSPDDGVRNGSEKLVENERFLGYVDGLSHDGLTLHENKTTSRAMSMSDQLLKYQMSLQIKLYAVLTGATGVILDIAFKDPPYGVYRAPRYAFKEGEVAAWEKGLNKLADFIYGLGDDPDNFPCFGDNCSLISRGMNSVCAYQPLCLGIEGAEICFKPKEHRK